MTGYVRGGSRRHRADAGVVVSASVVIQVVVGAVRKGDRGGVVRRCGVCRVQSKVGVCGCVEDVGGLGPVDGFRVGGRGRWVGLLRDGLRWRLIRGNGEGFLMDYRVIRGFGWRFWMAEWREFLWNGECRLLSYCDLGFLAESGYTRSRLYAGRSVTYFSECLVFVLPGEGNVLVDGFYGAVDVLRGAIQMSFGLDTDGSVVELSPVCDEQVLHVGWHVVDYVATLGGRMHSRFRGFDEIKILVRSVGYDVLRVP